MAVTDFNVGAVAELALPVVDGLAELLLAKLLSGGDAHALRIAVLFHAALDHLDEVVAELGLDRFGDLVGLERVHGLFEFGHGVAGLEPAEVAAAGRAVVDRVQASHRGEVGLARVDAALDVVEAVDHLAFGRDVAHEHQDVAGVGLFDRAAGELELNAVTGVGDAHDVPGVLALDDVDAFPGGFLEHVGHDVGQRLQVAPADVTALQRVGGARVGGGEHGEVLACAGALGDLLGMLLELFGVVGMVDRDQDVLDVAEDSEELETADEADLAVDEDEDTFEDEDSSEDSEE